MSFEIYIRGQQPGSSSEWSSVLNGGEEPLPTLSPEQREFVKKFGWDETEYRRSMLLGQDAQAIARDRGHLLGQIAENLLEALGSDYKLRAVVRNGGQAWVLRIETPIGVREVDVPLELANTVIDAGTALDRDRLKNLILFGVGRKELIFER